MVKETHRRGRRRARAASRRAPPVVSRLPAPPPSSLPSVPSHATEEARLSDARHWLKLTEPLRGLLSMRSEDAFLDAERLCPRQAYLVVHMDKRRVSDTPGALGSQRDALWSMLSAVAALCEWAERLHAWDDLSLVFWSNVLSSSMVESPVDSSWASKWVRYVKAHGVHILLRWHGHSRRVQALQDPLNQFFSTFCTHAFPPIVLELLDCGLSVEDIRWLHALLKKGGSVQGLYLSGNTFHTDGLTALAMLLEDPDPTLISELQLHDTMPVQASDLMSPSYVAAFRRVLAALFASKGLADTVGVSLSLGNHSNFSYEHVDALCSALWSASRPLKMLSLMNVRVVGVDAMKQLGRLLYSPCRTVANDSDINISGIHSDSHCNTLAAISSAVQELVTEALTHPDPVQCQCFAVDVFRDEAMTELLSSKKLDPRVFYAVQAVGRSGRVSITIPAETLASETLIGWIDGHSITSIRSAGGQRLVGWNFSGLIADRSGVLTLLPAAGVHLQRLALRGDRLLNWTPQAVKLLESCVNLQQLNLRKSSVYENFHTPLWDRLSIRLASSLRVLDVSDCFVDSASVSTLTKLSRLRCLLFRGAPTDWRDRLEKLTHVLHTRQSLLYLEIDYPPFELGCHLGARRLSIADDVKTAFLSVLAHLEIQHPSWKSVNEEVVVAILQYAGVVSSCVVNWTSPMWLKTPSVAAVLCLPR